MDFCGAAFLHLFQAAVWEDASHSSRCWCCEGGALFIKLSDLIGIFIGIRMDLVHGRPNHSYGVRCKKWSLEARRAYQPRVLWKAVGERPRFRSSKSDDWRYFVVIHVCICTHTSRLRFKKGQIASIKMDRVGLLSEFQKLCVNWHRMW